MKSIVIGVLLAVSLVLFGAQSAHAQTHPCDVTIVQSETFSGPVKVAFCSDLKDTDGLPTSITTVKVYLDANTTPTQTGILPSPTSVSPNAAGQNYYVMPPVTLSKGTHTLRATLSSSAGESLPSLPFGFAITLALPSVPIGLRTVK